MGCFDGVFSVLRTARKGASAVSASSSRPRGQCTPYRGDVRSAQPWQPSQAGPRWQQARQPGKEIQSWRAATDTGVNALLLIHLLSNKDKSPRELEDASSKDHSLKSRSDTPLSNAGSRCSTLQKPTTEREEGGSTDSRPICQIHRPIGL